MWARRGPNARPVGPDERFANAFVGPQRVGVARRKVPMSRVVVGRVPTSTPQRRRRTTRPGRRTRVDDAPVRLRRRATTPRSSAKAPQRAGPARRKVAMGTAVRERRYRL